MEKQPMRYGAATTDWDVLRAGDDEDEARRALQESMDLRD